MSATRIGTCYWLPSPRDFRIQLAEAGAPAVPATRLERLKTLAGCSLSPLETIQLNRAISRLLLESGEEIAALGVALIGGPTLDHLAPPLRVAALRHGLVLNVKVGGYGQHRQVLFDSASSMLSSSTHAVVLALTLADLVPPVAISASAAEVDGLLQAAVEDLRMLWRLARGTEGRVVVQQTLLDTAPPVFGSLDRVVAASACRVTAALNDRIAAAAATDGVLLLDIARFAARDGLALWYDPAAWLLAKQEVAPGAATLYGEYLARLLAAQRGLARKCLVLDLDNTLWGGVVGDDGVDGLVLGQGSATGEAFVALQRYAKTLRDRGIILAVCSKNDPAIAAAAFDEHPEMVLRRSDIAVFVANWNDKAANLRAIASRLNIGLDSVVFLDDNPAERARIRQDLPMVAVPELPADPAGYVRTLADAGYFESVAFTDADRDRSGQYAVEARREALRESAASIDDYLVSLEMVVTAGPFAPADLARVTQLFNKTNQFNTTTRRYSSDEIAQAMNSDGALTLQFRLSDRFGDNGLVSAMILRAVPADPGVMEVENWIMSCRVFGRELEYEALNIAVETARKSGAGTIRGRFIPTAKNGVIAGLFGRLGFREGHGAETWTLDLAAYHPHRTRIKRTNEHDQH